MKVKEIISQERAVKLIQKLVPYLENTQITIDHIGEYDKNGCRHIGAIAVVQFNKYHQITIWNSGIKFYRGDLHIGASAESDVSNVFDVFRMLQDWKLIN